MAPSRRVMSTKEQEAMQLRQTIKSADLCAEDPRHKHVNKRIQKKTHKFVKNERSQVVNEMSTGSSMTSNMQALDTEFLLGMALPPRITTDVTTCRKRNYAGQSKSKAHHHLPRPMWLDCDPGHDDALAIILAGHHKAVHLIGISTVFGNQSVSKTTDNALRVVQMAGLGDMCVVGGADCPLMRPTTLCPAIHGESGLDGPEIPAATNSAHTGVAPNVMYEKICTAHARWSKGRIALVSTGAMTNIALLFKLYPDVVDKVELVFMGGSIGIGNTHPVAEFNIQIDPEAAHIVLQHGAVPESNKKLTPRTLPITMVPLEVTHTALATEEILARIRSPNPSRFREVVGELLLFFQGTYAKVFGFQSPPLHDPCAVAYVADPFLFHTHAMRVDVEIKSGLCAGQTACDVWKTSPLPANVNVATKMNVSMFWDVMVDTLAIADQQSPLNASLAGGGVSTNRKLPRR